MEIDTHKSLLLSLQLLLNIICNFRYAQVRGAKFAFATIINL
nr:MAG TPA: hypothetical protein [Caudoviricetes sp.]